MIHEAVTEKLKEGVRADSPGMKYKHYAPKAKITILDADSKEFTEYVNSQKKEGLFALCFEEDVPFYGFHISAWVKMKPIRQSTCLQRLENWMKGAHRKCMRAVHPNKEWVLRCITA